ncbi:MAG: FAD-dependent oxidoreductase [Acidiferrobacterales bacterium]|nr:FAD-dependent oxidoreductase [Acidiferrobacterales bacterium]
MKTEYPQKSIAIIGAGISGLSCAYHLHNDFRVTVFEKESKLGGHTDTHTFTIDGEELNIDSGFIIYSRDTYPNFSYMLDELGVESLVTDMSFAVYNQDSGVVYNAASLNALFCQRRNLFSPRFYRMLFDLIRFYLTAKKVLNSEPANMTFEEYLKKYNYSNTFADDHLYPMISALWSTPQQTVKVFPIIHLVDFFARHGLLNLFRRPEWRVIKNGSKGYIDALKKQINCNWRIGIEVQKVVRENEKISVCYQQKQEHYDAVIFATHSDQTLEILGTGASEDEISILGNITYEKNHVIIHTDENIMHPNKLSWASWNAEVPNTYNPASLKCCTANYWMNSLQRLDIKANIFTSLNSHHKVDQEKILKERYYSHPVFTNDSVAAQKKKPMIDGRNKTYFVGAYWGWGFHEDGARSAAEVCKQLKLDLSGDQVKTDG